MIKPSDLCQIEIKVKNLTKSITFYENVFGWKAVPAEIHEVTVLSVPEDCPFGISLVLGKKANQTNPSRITLYYKTNDPEKIIEKAKAHGGRLRFGPKELRGYGTIYQIEDPDAQSFGLFSR